MDSTNATGQAIAITGDAIAAGGGAPRAIQLGNDVQIQLDGHRGPARRGPGAVRAAGAARRGGGRIAGPARQPAGGVRRGDLYL